MECATCANPTAARLCALCQCVAYCGDECARLDWNRHWSTVHMASHVHDKEEEHEIDEIPLPGPRGKGKLFVGGLEALLHLADQSIQAVISAIQYDNRHINEDRLRALIGANRAHMRVPWVDHEDQIMSLDTLNATAKFIDDHRKQGHNVLVHCAAGHSRSVSIIIFYMIHKQGWKSVEEALAHIQRVRPTAGPNDGFIAQLKLTCPHG